MHVTLEEFGVQFNIREDALISARRSPVAPNLLDVTDSLRRALDEPYRFPSLRRALTVDDRVAVVVDDNVPRIGELLATLLEYLTDSGIAPHAITLVSAPGSRQPWIDDIPDSMQEVRTEIHDPNDRKAVSYLASTKQGRRIYLNRTIVEADQTIVLSAFRSDPGWGIRNAATCLYPTLSDAETRSAQANAMDQHELDEVIWLFGLPFLVQVVEGAAGGVAHIVAGAVESIAEAQDLFTRRWQMRFDRPAQTVVVTLSGDSARIDFSALARAAASAARVVERGGRIILLSQAKPHLNAAMNVVREFDEIDDALRHVSTSHGVESDAVMQWLNAAQTAQLYLLSELPEETVEGLFAAPLQHARQAQRLIDAATSCLFLEDGHQAAAVVD